MNTFVLHGRTVDPARGWRWIVEGFELFRREPGPWIALVVVAALIFIALALVPVLGSLAAMVLAPVFAAGFVIACREEVEGRGVRVGHLFAGFERHFAPLATIGVLYLAVTVVLALVVGVLTGAGLWSLLGTGDAGPGAVAGATLTALIAFLVMMALLVPVFMALWFAPALVVFHERSAVEAMKASFVACLRNVVPFLVYGVIAFLLAMIASIPFGLGWLVLGPVLGASLYTGYRDIFFE